MVGFVERFKFHRLSKPLLGSNINVMFIEKLLVLRASHVGTWLASCVENSAMLSVYVPNVTARIRLV